MRIALVTDTYAPRVGGIETQVAGLALALREAGDDAVVVTATAGPAQADVIRVPGVGGAVPNPLAHKELRRVLSAGELVHAHVGVVSPFAWAAVEQALALGLPTVVTVHSMLGPMRRALAPLLRRWERHGALLTAVSDAAAREVCRAGVARVAVLPNAIRLGDWPRVITPEGPLTFVTTTRLVGRKRVVPLVRSFARAHLPDGVRLVVIGDGPQRSLVQEAARCAGVADAVRLTGRLAPEQVRAELGRAHAFVSPARLEAFGIAALEARASGLPVIALRGSGVAELVEDGVTGLLATDDLGLADAMTRLATEPDTLARLRAACATTPPYDWAQVTPAVRARYAMAEGAHATGLGCAT